ncbi:hypothetical protein SLE2022_124010 [Rubroshorea leprosula]
MEAHNYFSIFSFLLLSFVSGHQQLVQLPTDSLALAMRPNKLFVFGDSYADTGNLDFQAYSWNDPYGITFPGVPAGRFSNGRVFTDFLAEYLKIETPLPYTLWAILQRFTNTNIQLQQCSDEELTYGMNFAYGGTGVFAERPNMTTQIDYFEYIVNQSVYTESELNSSMAFVSLAGNDYSILQGVYETLDELESYVKQVVDQLAINLKRIYNLGVMKVAVNTLEPLGCLPENAITFQECNRSINVLSDIHNLYLREAVYKLNNETNSTSNFITLDLYTAFNTATATFENPYEACCVGTSSELVCGSVDANGERQYTVCDDPNISFFWDFAHPTQRGWEAVFSTPAMQESLEQIKSLSLKFK